MPPEIKQTQRVEQGLVLTPQLKKSLEILQASSLELSDIIAAELRTNPLLEDAAADGIAEKPQSVGESGDTYDDSDYDGADSPDSDGAKDENKRRDFALNSIPENADLNEQPRVVLGGEPAKGDGAGKGHKLGQQQRQ